MFYSRHFAWLKYFTYHLVLVSVLASNGKGGGARYKSLGTHGLIKDWKTGLISSRAVLSPANNEVCVFLTDMGTVKS
jgi:hypothetical protein